VVGLFGIEARLASRPAFPGLRILAYLCAAASIAFNLLMATAERAAALSSRGDLEAAGRRWEEASGFYRKALRLAPSQFNALISLGVCELQEGRLDEAGRQLGKAVALYPESADAHLEYALDLYFLRRFDEAAAQCREALRLNPTLPGARQGLQKIEAARGT
jgi:tetratricopeptide (TPR) repeat protein